MCCRRFATFLKMSEYSLILDVTIGMFCRESNMSVMLLCRESQCNSFINIQVY